MNKNLIFITFFIILSSIVHAVTVYDRLPEQVDPKEKYVFYSHGKIVEGTNSTPIHLRWGTYEFPQIKKVLSDNNYNLIAYHRATNTNPKLFAAKLASDVALLIKQGVKPKNITLLGFSRGGEITIRASNLLMSKKVNVILLASCAGFMKNRTDFKVYGKVYSIYETSDGVGSCQFLIDQSPDVTSFEEVSISTGKEHGAFFRPIPEWVNPVKAWLNQ